MPIVIRSVVSYFENDQLLSRVFESTDPDAVGAQTVVFMESLPQGAHVIMFANDLVLFDSAAEA